MSFSTFSLFNDGIFHTQPYKEVTLSEFVSIVKGKTNIFLIEEIRAERDKEARDKLKEKLDYATLSVTCTKRKKEFVKKHSGYLQIDIDFYNGDFAELRSRIEQDEYTASVFDSPSGKLKAVVRIPPSQDLEHTQRFYAARSFFSDRWELASKDIDEKAKDIVRACYVSYDPKAYLNENAKIFEGIDKNTPISQPVDYSILNEGVSQGSRNDALFKLACSLRSKNVEAIHALALLEQANMKNSPPLSSQELNNILSSAYRYPNTLQEPKNINAKINAEYLPIWKPIINSKGDVIKNELLIANLAENIKKNYNFVTIGEDRLQTFKYKEGRWVQGGNVLIAKECQRWTDGQVKNNQIQEVIGQLQRTTWQEKTIFDTTPENLICLANCVFDLKTSEPHPHSPDYYFLQRQEVCYVGGADCPEIKKYLSEVLSPQDIATLQEFIGFCLYRKYFIKKAMIFWGGKNTGKTTTINLIVKFLGQENTSSVSLHKLLTDKFSAQDLHGKLLNFYDDLSYKNLNDLGGFKIAVGTGYTAAEKKFGEQFKFLNFAKLLFATNKFSAVIDSDDLAYYERWLIIRFQRTFENGKANRNILDRLTKKEEFEGLFIWALEGLRRLLDKGTFSYSMTAEDNRNIMEADSNSVSAFILDCVGKAGGEWVSTIELFEAYSDYCEVNDKPKETLDKFSKTFGTKATFAIPKQKDYTRDGKTLKNARGYLHVYITTNTNNTFSEFKGKKIDDTPFIQYDLEKDVKDVKTIKQQPTAAENKP